MFIRVQCPEDAANNNIFINRSEDWKEVKRNEGCAAYCVL